MGRWEEVGQCADGTGAWEDWGLHSPVEARLWGDHGRDEARGEGAGDGYHAHAEGVGTMRHVEQQGRGEDRKGSLHRAEVWLVELGVACVSLYAEDR